jgi:bacterioferritin-associated ferredoxin
VPSPVRWFPAALAVRDTEISQETEIREVGGMGLCCGHCQENNWAM